MKKDTTKRGGSIDPRALINKIKFIAVMGSTGLIHIGVLSSWNFNILWNKYAFDFCVFLPYILHFNW